ncbi:MAG: LysM peptidoglycan-binding domain-containing protein [Verrucomicrobia bacterium]|nr:LysM peptidoglycan-binding domain-containing protein [Verrucomicrobiota bacterium]
MNNPNPLLPQGSILEHHKSRGKSNLIIAVFTILAIHVVLFTGLLMQGCKREPTANKEALTTAETNPLPSIDTNVPAPVVSNPPPPVTSNVAVAPPPVVVPPPPAPAPETPAGTKEYTVVKGDTFYTIAKANGVSISAIAKANPGVNSRRLKVGQKLQIPAAGETAHAGAGEAAAGETGMTTYTVKSGDTLGRIAKRHGTTVKAIKAANALRTDRITVGQKLKLPSAKAAAPAAPAETAPAEAAPTNPAPTVPAPTNPATLPRV